MFCTSKMAFLKSGHLWAVASTNETTWSETVEDNSKIPASTLFAIRSSMTSITKNFIKVAINVYKRSAQWNKVSIILTIIGQNFEHCSTA